MKHQDDDTAIWGDVDASQWPKITLYWDRNNIRKRGA
jgi:hypothetical protein